MVTSVSLVLETHIPCYCEADQKKRSPSTLELLIVSKSLRIKIRRSFRFKIIYSMADLELQEKEVTQWITRWWFQTFLFSPRSLEKWFYLTIFQLGFSSTKRLDWHIVAICHYLGSRTPLLQRTFILPWTARLMISNVKCGIRKDLVYDPMKRCRLINGCFKFPRNLWNRFKKNPPASEQLILSQKTLWVNLIGIWAAKLLVFFVKILVHY